MIFEFFEQNLATLMIHKAHTWEEPFESPSADDRGRRICATPRVLSLMLGWVSLRSCMQCLLLICHPQILTSGPHKTRPLGR